MVGAKDDGITDEAGARDSASRAPVDVVFGAGVPATDVLGADVGGADVVGNDVAALVGAAESIFPSSPFFRRNAKYHTPTAADETKIAAIMATMIILLRFNFPACVLL